VHTALALEDGVAIASFSFAASAILLFLLQLQGEGEVVVFLLGAREDGCERVKGVV
jgi:hypothetical protein